MITTLQGMDTGVREILVMEWYRAGVSYLQERWELSAYSMMTMEIGRNKHQK